EELLDNEDIDDDMWRGEGLPEELAGAALNSVSGKEQDNPSSASERLVSEVAEASEVSLNGAQITSLIAVVQTYNSGMLERDSAIEIIMSAFPFDREKAERILGSGKLKGVPGESPSSGGAQVTA
ncbi:MAG: hypothetical protein LBS19_15960, partial [Clostridiales bacterium]|nr:hypothetical protein [Clostridiales bacterium]